MWNIHLYIYHVKGRTLWYNSQYISPNSFEKELKTKKNQTHHNQRAAASSRVVVGTD